jgi:hypothetical protein
VKVLTGQSGPAVEWLTDAFDLDLSLVSQLGGHSFPRTHRGKERFPGMTITYALMEKVRHERSTHHASHVHRSSCTDAITTVVLACVSGTTWLVLIRLALASSRMRPSTS